MDQGYFFIAFFVLITSVVVSRVIQEKGYKQLSADEKVKLLDGFSGLRIWANIPMLGLALGFYLLYVLHVPDFWFWYFVLFALIFLYQFILVYWVYRKMTEMQISSGYIRFWGISRLIVYSGMILFIFILYINVI